LDFGFWILDFGLETKVMIYDLTILIASRKQIQNPKSKIGKALRQTTQGFFFDKSC
jgi:hypothetical protein